MTETSTPGAIFEMPALLNRERAIFEVNRRVLAQARRADVPLLEPVGLDRAHPFPQVANKSLNFIARLGGKDAFGRVNPFAIVKVPRVLPRVIRLPDKLAGSDANGRLRQVFVLLTSVIRAHL